MKQIPKERNKGELNKIFPPSNKPKTPKPQQLRPSRQNPAGDPHPTNPTNHIKTREIYLQKNKKEETVVDINGISSSYINSNNKAKDGGRATSIDEYKNNCKQLLYPTKQSQTRNSVSNVLGNQGVQIHSVWTGGGSGSRDSNHGNHGNNIKSQHFTTFTGEYSGSMDDILGEHGANSSTNMKPSNVFKYKLRKGNKKGKDGGDSIYNNNMSHRGPSPSVPHKYSSDMLRSSTSMISRPMSAQSTLKDNKYTNPVLSKYYDYMDEGKIITNKGKTNTSTSMQSRYTTGDNNSNLNLIPKSITGGTKSTLRLEGNKYIDKGILGIGIDMQKSARGKVSQDYKGGSTQTLPRNKSTDNIQFEHQNTQNEVLIGEKSRAKLYKNPAKTKKIPKMKIYTEFKPGNKGTEKKNPTEIIYNHEKITKYGNENIETNERKREIEHKKSSGGRNRDNSLNLNENLLNVVTLSPDQPATLWDADIINIHNGNRSRTLSCEEVADQIDENPANRMPPIFKLTPYKKVRESNKIGEIPPPVYIATEISPVGDSKILDTVRSHENYENNRKNKFLENFNKAKVDQQSVHTNNQHIESVESQVVYKKTSLTQILEEQKNSNSSNVDEKNLKRQMNSNQGKSQDGEINKNKNKFYNSNKVKSVVANYKVIKDASKLEIFLDESINTKIIEFLSIKEIIKLMRCAKVLHNRFSLRLRQKIIITLINGIDEQTRKKYWLNICNIKTFLEENIDHKAHFEILSTTDSKSKIEIEKDIDRTFPKEHIFHQSNISREQFYITLNAFSNNNPNIGYTQGLNFIAGNILILLKDPELSFMMLEHISNKMGFSDYLKDQLPKLKLSLIQLDVLVELYLPECSEVFNKKGISVEYFAIEWIMTLFSYDIAIPLLFQIWDLFFLFGWKFIIQFSLSLIQFIHPELEMLELEDSLHFIKNFVKEGNIISKNGKHILHNALKFKLTDNLLDKIEQIFQNTLESRANFGFINPEEKKQIIKTLGKAHQEDSIPYFSQERSNLYNIPNSTYTTNKDIATVKPYIQIGIPNSTKFHTNPITKKSTNREKHINITEEGEFSYENYISYSKNPAFGPAFESFLRPLETERGLNRKNIQFGTQKSILKSKILPTYTHHQTSSLAQQHNLVGIASEGGFNLAQTPLFTKRKLSAELPIGGTESKFKTIKSALNSLTSIFRGRTISVSNPRGLMSGKWGARDIGSEHIKENTPFEGDKCKVGSPPNINTSPGARARARQKPPGFGFKLARTDISHLKPPRSSLKEEQNTNHKFMKEIEFLRRVPGRQTKKYLSPAIMAKDLGDSTQIELSPSTYRPRENLTQSTNSKPKTKLVWKKHSPNKSYTCEYSQDLADEMSNHRQRLHSAANTLETEMDNNSGYLLTDHIQNPRISVQCNQMHFNQIINVKSERNRGIYEYGFDSQRSRESWENNSLGMERDTSEEVLTRPLEVATRITYYEGISPTNARSIHLAPAPQFTKPPQPSIPKIMKIEQFLKEEEANLQTEGIYEGSLILDPNSAHKFCLTPLLQGSKYKKCTTTVRENALNQRKMGQGRSLTADEMQLEKYINNVNLSLEESDEININTTNKNLQANLSESATTQQNKNLLQKSKIIGTNLPKSQIPNQTKATKKLTSKFLETDSEEKKNSSLFMNMFSKKPKNKHTDPTILKQNTKKDQIIYGASSTPSLEIKSEKNKVFRNLLLNSYNDNRIVQLTKTEESQRPQRNPEDYKININSTYDQDYNNNLAHKEPQILSQNPIFIKVANKVSSENIVDTDDDQASENSSEDWENSSISSEEKEMSTIKPKTEDNRNIFSQQETILPESCNVSTSTIKTRDTGIISAEMPPNPFGVTQEKRVDRYRNTLKTECTKDIYKKNEIRAPQTGRHAHINNTNYKNINVTEYNKRSQMINSTKNNIKISNPFKQNNSPVHSQLYTLAESLFKGSHGHNKDQNTSKSVQKERIRGNPHNPPYNPPHQKILSNKSVCSGINNNISNMYSPKRYGSRPRNSKGNSSLLYYGSEGFGAEDGGKSISGSGGRFSSLGGGTDKSDGNKYVGNLTMRHTNINTTTNTRYDKEKGGIGVKGSNLWKGRKESSVGENVKVAGVRKSLDFKLMKNKNIGNGKL